MKQQEAVEEFNRLYDELPEEQKKLVIDFIIKDYEEKNSDKAKEN